MEEDAEISEIRPSDSDYTLKREIIRCNNITKEFEIGEYVVLALDSISFEVYRGEFIVFQGPSGAGKSTLLSLLGGLDSPSKGEIFIEWVKISDLSEESMSVFRAGTIGFIFQNYNLISSLTAEENILFPMQLTGMEPSIQEQRVHMLLEKINLQERTEHLPFQLSSGEQQRVGIARAMANDPTIILADEPTANLDKRSSKIIAELFSDMSQEGKTIIIATHDDKLIEQANRVFTIEDGKIVAEKKQKEAPDFETIPIPTAYRKCPNCNKLILPGLKSCSFCGVVLPKKE
ncbi:MAG: ATP-binding cassette domain-containing protein [Candidatus Lokiarchaeota archaeon]|nr:ATP-binding cassette domain-containing protein [Candidatus Lokiarchaeota archaeon]